MRTRATRAGVFDNDDIVGPGSELRGALGRVQNKLRADSKLPFLEFTQTAVNRTQIPVDKEDVQGAMPVDMRVLRAHSFAVRTRLALCQVCHSAHTPHRPCHPQTLGIGGMEVHASPSG